MPSVAWACFSCSVTEIQDQVCVRQILKSSWSEGVGRDESSIAKARGVVRILLEWSERGKV